MRIRWYWLSFVRGPLVTFHLLRPYEVRWRVIRGVQIGSWFVGAMRSADVPLPPDLRREPAKSVSRGGMAD